MLMTSLIALALPDVEVQRRTPVPMPPQTVLVPPPPAPPIILNNPPPIVHSPPPPVLAPPVPPTPPVAPPTPARIISGTLSSADFPPAALRAGVSGTSRVRFDVSAAGRATGCEVVASSGYRILDDAACTILSRRLRFQPASRDGRAVAGTFTTPVVWRHEDSFEPVRMDYSEGRLSWTVTTHEDDTDDGCRKDLIGTTFAAFTAGSCGYVDIVSLVKDDAVGADDPVVAVTQILSLIPRSGASTLPALPSNAVWEESLELEIAPDGRVSSCRRVSGRGALPDYVEPLYRSSCEELMIVPRFNASAAGATRRALFQSSVYVAPVS